MIQTLLGNTLVALFISLLLTAVYVQPSPVRPSGAPSIRLPRWSDILAFSRYTSSRPLKTFRIVLIGISAVSLSIGMFRLTHEVSAAVGWLIVYIGLRTILECFGRKLSRGRKVVLTAVVVNMVAALALVHVVSAEILPPNGKDGPPPWLVIREHSTAVVWYSCAFAGPELLAWLLYVKKRIHESVHRIDGRTCLSVPVQLTKSGELEIVLCHHATGDAPPRRGIVELRLRNGRNRVVEDLGIWTGRNLIVTSRLPAGQFTLVLKNALNKRIDLKIAVFWIDE